MSDQAKPEVVLVDLTGLFWRAWHTSGEDGVTAARGRTVELVHQCIGGNFQGPVALCCDLGRSFRKTIDETYKANRPEKDLQVLDELKRTQKHLADEGFLLWGEDGFEADDIIATATKMAVDAGHTVKIASADKDLLQLLRFDGVRVLRTHNMKLVERADFISAFKIPPFLFGDWLALVGDTSDNIRGVPGVGDKTAAALLLAHPGLIYLLDAAKSGALAATTGIKASVARAVAENAENIRHARKLVELRFDAPIEFDEIHVARGQERAAATQTEETTTMGTQTELASTSEMGGGSPAQQGATVQASPVGAEQAPQVDAKMETAGLALPAQQKTQTRALVIPEIVGPFELALEPVGPDMALNMAKVLWKSRLYSRFPNEEALFAVIARGRELSIPALVALDVFHFMPDVNRIAPHAHLITALVEKDPNCEYFMCVETDDQKATYETKHRRQPRAQKLTYSIQQAVDAGLCQLQIIPRDWNAKDGKDHRGNWDKRRSEMLRKTAATQLARIVYPAAALGLYSVEELDNGEPAVS